MSFGLKISFGRLCRLEQQRREAFDTDKPVLRIETDDFIYQEYKDFDSTTCNDFSNGKKWIKLPEHDSWRISFNKCFSYLDKKCMATLIDNCI